MSSDGVTLKRVGEVYMKANGRPVGACSRWEGRRAREEAMKSKQVSSTSRSYMLATRPSASEPGRESVSPPLARALPTWVLSVPPV